jgi:hypothetical protein
MSCLLGQNRDIFFPQLSGDLDLITFSEIAVRYLESLGYEPCPCSTEEEARGKVEELAASRKWPCYFFESDTTGEKGFEEFYTADQLLDKDRFEAIGVIRNEAEFDSGKLDKFESSIKSMRRKGSWTKEALVELFKTMIPEFEHKEKGKYLDQKM